MKHLWDNPGAWFVALGAINFMFFLLRGLTVIRWRLFTRIIISLSCLCMAMVFFPRPVSETALQLTAALVIIFATFLMAADSAVILIRKVRRRAAPEKNVSLFLADYLEEICKALEVLASRRIGALIVLERNDRVEGHLVSSIPFESQVKSEALLALFAAASPLHDGAVVVSSGRIRRVKAIISLKTAGELPMGVGTRHRSAVSITEKTDAIALVASEERGEISIAHQGCLVKVGEPAQLYSLIQTALKGKSIAAAKKGPACE